MKLHEAIVAGVAREGTEAVFGLMGDGNLKLIPSLTTVGVSYYGARHESGAVAMADGFARVTGSVGVCTFTQGPGLTNALTALVSARRGHTPLVVLAGDTPTTVPGLPQDIEQAPFFAAAGIAVQPLALETAARDIAAGFARARLDRRPVAINLPTDIQEAECGYGEISSRGENASHGGQSRPSAMPDLDGAVELLAKAQRPVVIAGRGAVRSGARDELVALADRIGALLAHSLPVKGWFATHPFDLGIAGGFASGLAQRLIGEADVVVVFGATLNHFTSRGGTLLSPETKIVQCDVDAAAFGRYVPAAETIEGDAAVVAHALAERLPFSSGWRSPALEVEIATERGTVPDESMPGQVDPRALSKAIDKLVPVDRTLVVDGGHFMGFPSMHMSVPDPSRFIFTQDFGSIGLGIGAAIGAAVAKPDRVTVVAIGDGGLLMSLGELDTAVRYRLPLLIVVFNDGAYGAEMHFLRMLGLPDEESCFKTPPLDAVARAIGADAHVVSTLDDLKVLGGSLPRLDRPLLLDCKISRDVRANWLEEAFERGTH